MERWRLGRRPGLDGLRGVAILLVIACHAWPGHALAAGPAGVTVFFVLSGFLITSLLIEEHDRTGDVSMGRFYVRRARRLLPAVAVLLAVLLWARAVTFDQAGTVALYAANWRMVLHPDAMGTLGHMWSLSVEEQFYLVFPAAAVLLLRRSRRVLLAACLVGVAVSLGERVVLAVGGHDVWLTYGTDTNAVGLLAGCALAVGFASGWRPVLNRWWVLASLAGLLLVIAVSAGRSPTVPVAASFLALVMVTAAVRDGYRGLLTAGWLRYVGRRSYALYLWHYALMTDARRGVLPIWAALLLALALAEVSWWLVERPFLRLSSAERQDTDGHASRAARDGADREKRHPVGHQGVDG